MLRYIIRNCMALVLLFLLMSSVFTTNTYAQTEVTAGQLSAVATIRCVGLEWKVAGDTNGNAAANVRFREQGTSTWYDAMPLYRIVSQEVTTQEPYMIGQIKVTMPPATNQQTQYLIDQCKKNCLAGSVFHLKPGTDYEFQVSLADPDGGMATQTVTATTGTEPLIPATGNVISVTGGGNALADAVSGAKAGDIITVKAGAYSGFTVSVGGTAEKPVCIVAEPGEEVIIRGGGTAKGNTCITISGAYVYMHGLTINNCWKGIDIYHSADNVAVMRCTIQDARYCIMTRADYGYIADNTILASYDPVEGATSGEGIQIDDGMGNVICYNKIRGAADGCSIYTFSSDTDFYGNDVMFCGDDGLEYDYGAGTSRVWGNLFVWNGYSSVSFQPYVSGPGYLVNNVMINGEPHIFKDRYESSHLIVVNNTIVLSSRTELPMCTYSRNNLYYNPGSSSPYFFSIYYHYEDFMFDRPLVAPLNIDYDGLTGRLLGYTWNTEYFTTDYEKSIMAAHGARSLEQFKTDFKQELHGIQLSTVSTTVFANPLPAIWPKTGHSTNFDEQTYPPPDFSLSAASEAIDKGIALPNIIGGYSGTAPDLGGLEYGSAISWGPRPDSGWTYPWVPFYPAVSMGETEMSVLKKQHTFAVSQNSPNPFNLTTTISYTIPDDGNVIVDVFNITGQKVDTIENGFNNAGRHSVTWRASDFSTGVYLYTVRSGNFSKTMKMILLK